MTHPLPTESIVRPLARLAGVLALGPLALSACTSSDSGMPAYGSTGGTVATGGSSSGGSAATGGTASGGASGGPETGGAANDAGQEATLAVNRTNLVADDGSATTTDPMLLNAWGLAINPNAPGGPFFWVSSNHAGVATVYDATGNVIPLVVNVRPGDGGALGAPTGQVFNTTTAFGGDKFIIDGEDGTVTGWQSGTTAALRSDRSSTGAIYKGLTIVAGADTPSLWAANFHAGTVDVFDASYQLSTTSPSDPDIPSGFAPFNVESIGGKVYVAYAKQDADKEDDVPGAGNGYIDVFSPDGSFDHRLVSGGVLDSPWAMEIAPSGFGPFGGALLVGNFGDGMIHAFDADSGRLLGTLVTSSADPLLIAGLWDLKFGPTTATVDLSRTLFFTAGPGGEVHGVFGKLEIAP